MVGSNGVAGADDGKIIENEHDPSKVKPPTGDAGSVLLSATGRQLSLILPQEV